MGGHISSFLGSLASMFAEREESDEELLERRENARLRLNKGSIENRIRAQRELDSIDDILDLRSRKRNGQARSQNRPPREHGYGLYKEDYPRSISAIMAYRTASIEWSFPSGISSIQLPPCHARTP